LATVTASARPAGTGSSRSPHSPRGPRIAVIQHEDGCPLGLFDGWLRDTGARIDVVRPYRGDPLPTAGLAGSHEAPDGLVVLGGSMSATDDDRAPWLPGLRALMRQAVDAAVPLLGICLGHQLLAVACGGEVEPNPAGKQLGVLPVGVAPLSHDERLFGRTARRSDVRAIQWNDDIVVRLPAGATVLAATPQGIPQAMRVGDAAWGVQFHPEADHGIVAAWAAESGPVTPAESAALAVILNATDELEATWRPFAARFVEIAADARQSQTTAITSQ
jgi:GMP synthase (glutamine-hydrolysing)